jgi:hypothetical protein
MFEQAESSPLSSRILSVNSAEALELALPPVDPDLMPPVDPGDHEAITARDPAHAFVASDVNPVPAFVILRIAHPFPMDNSIDSSSKHPLVDADDPARILLVTPPVPALAIDIDPDRAQGA